MITLEAMSQDVKELELVRGELRELKVVQQIRQLRQVLEEHGVFYREESNLNVAAELGRFEEAICELRAEEACERPTLAQEV